MVKFSDEIGQNWVDVMSDGDLYNGISLNVYFLFLKIIIIGGKDKHF